jgi:hypothetical protein
MYGYSLAEKRMFETIVAADFTGIGLPLSTL